MVLRGGDVTLPPWERYLNWVPDPAPPPTRYHGDLTSPAPSGNEEKTPPQDASRKLPRRLWPRRRKKKQPGSSTNGNPASRTAGSATQPGSPANRNPALSGSSAATRPRLRPMRIRRFQEIGLEPAGQEGVPQWSIHGPSCAHSIHSIPDFQPITLRNADFTPTTLNSRVYINWPSQASSSIQPTDFVETPSPDLASPHLPFSDLIETSSLNRHLGS